MCIAYHVIYRCGHRAAYGNLIECDIAKQAQNIAALDPAAGVHPSTAGDIIMQAGVIHRVTAAEAALANQNAQPVAMPANVLPPNAPPGRVIPVGSQAVPGTGIPCRLVNLPFGSKLKSRCSDCKELNPEPVFGLRKRLSILWPF